MNRTGMKSGAEALGLRPSEVSLAPPLTEREYYALHAPPAPNWWKLRTPEDYARWCWTWADAMLRTKDLATDPGSASPVGALRP